MRGLSLVVVSEGHSSSRCAGLSLSRPLLLRSTGSGRTGSVVVAHGPSCSAACGIFPDQGLNLCPLHWQADSQPLRHQGSPEFSFAHTSYPVSMLHNPTFKIYSASDHFSQLPVLPPGPNQYRFARTIAIVSTSAYFYSCTSSIYSQNNFLKM